MIHRVTLRILLILAVVTPFIDAGAADESADSATEPLSHLIESVERLRSRSIPQAYFWLLSPQAPNSTIFFPDTQGGALILIGRVVRLPKGNDAKTVLAEIREVWPKSDWPILDEKNNRLLYYSDEAWRHLEETLRPWVTDTEGIRDLAAANQWSIDDTDLIIRIPAENEAEFFSALMRAWKTNEGDFRCFVGWN